MLMAAIHWDGKSDFSVHGGASPHSNMRDWNDSVSGAQGGMAPSSDIVQSRPVLVSIKVEVAPP
jgi:hypothetical protein